MIRFFNWMAAVIAFPRHDGGVHQEHHCIPGPCLRHGEEPLGDVAIQKERRND